MRPRLLGDVRYIECPEGVYIHGGLGSCLLAGRSVHRWIEVLAPRLQGRHSLDEITRGLPEEHREMVESLVATLVEQRFVVVAIQPEVAVLRDLVQAACGGASAGGSQGPALKSCRRASSLSMPHLAAVDR